MNKHLFKRELNGAKISGTLSVFSTVELVLGSILAVLTFLSLLIMGIATTAETNSLLSFFVMLFLGIGSGIGIFLASYICSIFLKALAAITLHTYISALNSENTVETMLHKKS